MRTTQQILKSIIKAMAILLCITTLFHNGVSAQYRTDQLYGIRIGADLSRIVVHYTNPYRTDFTVHADARIDSNWYFAAEAGWNKTHLDNKPVFDYKSNGIFLKAGADYNLLHPTFPFESNMVYIGLRYGIARMDREVPEYQIQYPYWGNVKGSFPSKTLLPQWAEAIIGMKVEVLNNLFLDWGLHLRMLTTQNVDKEVRPYLIPGFGKATSNVVFDVNYTISYRIPLWKPRPKKVKKVTTKPGDKEEKSGDKKETPPEKQGKKGKDKD